MAGSSDGRLSASELSQAALTTVDALELPRIPNTTDVLASYVVQLDEGGTLRGFKRSRRFQRGHASEG